MPLIVPGKFRQFVREMANAQKPGSPVHAAIMTGVKASLQARIKDQFLRGVGPDDARHKPKANGRPALVSRKLGNAARARITGAVIWIEPKTPHVGDILDTQQDGHTFPKRDGRVYQYRARVRDKKTGLFRDGGLVSYSKFLRRIRDTSVGDATYQNLKIQTYRKTTVRGKNRIAGERFIVDRVKFGPRRLPPRPIRPVGRLTRPWEKALADGVTGGAAKRLDKYTAK